MSSMTVSCIIKLSSKNMSYKKLFTLILTSYIISRCKANYCGKSIFYNINGTIKTDPTSSDKNATCLWTVHLPKNVIMTVNILQADLSKCSSNSSCCLSIVDADIKKERSKFCNENPGNGRKVSLRGRKALVLLQASQKIYAWIDFSSRPKTECPHSDFQCHDKSGCYNSSENCLTNVVCKDHSDKLNCGKCQINFTPCNLNSKNCFDPITQRCDGKIQCFKAQDELGCSDLCPNMIKCPNQKKCIQPEQICNRQEDCSDGFDEKHCYMADSPSTYFTFIFIISSLCLMLFLCIILQWFFTRRSTQRLLNNPPDFPVAPFEGPGEQEGETSSTEIFTDSEFRQGGGIYESYMQNVKKPKPVKPVQLNTNRRKSYMDLDADNELIVLASLNVPVEMCIGLALSKEQVDLTEAIRQERNVSKSIMVINQAVPLKSSRSSDNLCVNENLRESSRQHSNERATDQTVIETHSSEWTDIEDASDHSSKIIFVKSAKNTSKRNITTK